MTESETHESHVHPRRASLTLKETRKRIYETGMKLFDEFIKQRTTYTYYEYCQFQVIIENQTDGRFVISFRDDNKYNVERVRTDEQLKWRFNVKLETLETFKPDFQIRFKEWISMLSFREEIEHFIYSIHPLYFEDTGTFLFYNSSTVYPVLHKAKHVRRDFQVGHETLRFYVQTPKRLPLLTKDGKSFIQWRNYP